MFLNQFYFWLSIFIYIIYFCICLTTVVIFSYVFKKNIKFAFFKYYVLIHIDMFISKM